MFVGFSHVHSSLVPLVLNVVTGKISPQYHVVFDDTFSTVNSLPHEDSIDDQWTRIFKLEREFYLDIEYDEDGKLITSDWPPLSTEWLDPTAKGTVTVLSCPVNKAPGGASSDEAIQAPGGARIQDGPAKNTRSQVSSNEFEPASFTAARIWGQPPAAIANLGQSSIPSQFHGNSKLTKAYIAAWPTFSGFVPLPPSGTHRVPRLIRVVATDRVLGFVSDEQTGFLLSCDLYVTADIPVSG